ncbi:MarR family winged helix-turn-helix transcriptional regulator [Nonomuraea dietziae]|uniref:DNA-binding MarR family transcriptional regulator n=1 Tax=Nonomuraea dietziae TaxID=65515 RepID=A0A7W5YNI6_9ACTN|nr:MarR family transcriptional regulator [Nonomuraea dietziae]MBB3727507.1 DNA-binding MarR family transcriptional regulator [Nonomuraea dietziae]
MSTGDMRHLGDDPATPARLRQIPSRLLSIAAAQADRSVSAGLAAADAHKWHYAVLAALDDSGQASQATLSRRTGIYRSDLVSVINELAGRGLVRRENDLSDRRRNIITLTAEGREQLSRLDHLVSALQDDVLAPLSPAEREQLVGLLTRLVQHHAT